jgi:N-acetylglucosaminyldiphosphoundecaprenol N-acetyl-beta-D-mannosaminyltransferase
MKSLPLNEAETPKMRAILPGPGRYVTTLGYRVYNDDLGLIPIAGDETRVMNTISPNSYGIALKDAEFREALQTSNYLMLDGVYFAVASVMLQGKNIRRNQGPDIFDHFMRRLEDMKGTAFFMGSMPSTLELIKQNAAKDYPHIKIHTYSPPFKPVFSDEDNKAIVEAVNAASPDILFVGMTCPKQEKWAIAQRPMLNPTLVVCIGNVFDWYAGTQKRIHPIWFKLRVGWLVRIFLRPEIFRRNIGNQMTFFGDVLLHFLRIKRTN